MENLLTHAKLSRDAWQHQGDSRFVFYTDTDTDTEICIFKEFDQKSNNDLLGKSGRCTVIFKYSDSAKDWSYNFKSKLVAVPWDQTSRAGCCNTPKIHEGFLTKFLTVRDWIEQHITSPDKAFDSLSFTGFSLGGALATLASHWAQSLNFQRNLTQDVQCYVFGSPRVGNNSFVNHYNNTVNCSSVVYKNDPVPTLPPRASCYRHIEKPLWLREDYKVEFSLRPSTLNAKLFINWILKNVCKCKCVGDQMTDHNISKIIDFLEHIVDPD